MANANEEYKKLNAETLKLAKSHKALEQQLKSLIGVQKKLFDQMKKGGAAKQFADTQKALANNMIAVERVEQQRLKTLQQVEALEQKRIRTQEAQARASARQAKETAKQRQMLDRLANSYKTVDAANAKLVGAYKRESAQLTQLRNRAKDLAIQYGINSREFRRAADEVNRLDGRLRQIDSRLGQHQRNVGNYRSALGGLGNQLRSVAGALGFAGGVQALVSVFRQGVDITRKFEKANAELAGVLGKSRKETERLQKESKRLGASTSFTSIEVVELQTELARLGKTEDEIIASTEGIIDATVALGSETGETAALVGSTLNAFQLGAEESARVADVLTLSTQKSALSFEKLNTALPIVAGAAGAAGVSMETLIAQLGQAADRGIDASSAASSLRNIYIELAAKGLTLDEALGKINNSQNKLSTATELFGKRAAVTALSLASTTDKTKDLTTALENAGGTAERVANEQLNTLDGQLTILNSAWEGFLQTIFKTEGATQLVKELQVIVGNLTNSIKGAVTVGKEFGEQISSNIISTSKTAVEANDRLTKSYKDQQEQLQWLNDQRKQLEQDLKDAAGVGNFLAGGVGTGDIQLEINKIDELIERTKAGAEEISKALKKNNQAVIDETREAAIARIDLTDETTEELIRLEQNYRQVQNLLTDEQSIRLEAYQRELVKREKAAIDAAKKEAAATTSLIEIQEELLKQAKKLSEATETDIAFKNRRIATINKEIERLKKLGETQEELIKKDTSFSVSSDMEGDKLKAIVAAQRKAADEEVSITQEALEKKKELRKQYAIVAIDSAMQVASSIFSVRQMNREQETQAELLAMDERINNEQLDDEQRAELQKQKTAREKQLRRENAVAQKKDALFQVGISTALALIKQLVATPLPLGAPFVAAVAAAGAIQAALIASRPIPQFDKGTKSLPSLSEVAEKRPELVLHHGRADLITKPTVLGKEFKGAEVIGGAETAKILDQAARGEVVNNVSLHNDKKQEMMIAAYVSKEFGKYTNKVVDAIHKSKVVFKKDDLTTARIRQQMRGE